MFRTIINKLRLWLVIQLTWGQEPTDDKPADEPAATNFNPEDIQAARRAIINNADRYGLAPDGETVAIRMSTLNWLIEMSMPIGYILSMRMAATPREALMSVADGMNPAEARIDNKTTIPGVPVVLTRANEDGVELFEAVVRTKFGDRLKDVARVEVKSHVTVFLDTSGTPIVGFIAAGRKMHHESPFRAYNASKALALVGITMPVKDIAIPDLSDYPEIIFERQADGSWDRTDHKVPC